MIVLGVLMASASGCERHTRHKVLTFFFTGVPPLEEGKKPVEEEKEAAEVSAAREKRRLTLQATPFAHGPYGARLCDHCHKTSSALSFRSFAGKGTGGTARAGRGMTGMLVAPRRELCTECHAYKSPQRAYERGLWLHGPVAGGSCMLCHSPHKSPNPYVLRKKPGEICLECHSEGYIMNTASHRRSRDCLSCHNPHLGKEMSLLKKDYHEIF